MNAIVLTLDEASIERGFIHTTKITALGRRSGYMELTGVMDLLNEVFRWETRRRDIKLFSRFTEHPYVAFGQNGSRWQAVKDISPGEYFLTTVSGGAHKVNLPRLVAKISNHGAGYLFWTPDETLTPQSKLYPLVIGNINTDGWICTGTTGLRCEKPDDIDKYVRQVIEAPSTGTYIPAGVNVERFYRSLEDRWDESVGAKHGITLDTLITKHGQ